MNIIMLIMIVYDFKSNIQIFHFIGVMHIVSNGGRPIQKCTFEYGRDENTAYTDVPKIPPSTSIL